MPLKISFDSAMYQVVLFLAFVAPLSTAAASVGVGLGVLFLLVCYVRTRELPQFDLDLLEVLAVYLVCEASVAAMSLEPATSLREVFGELHHFIPMVFAMTFIKKRDQLCGVLIATLAAALINDVAGIWQYFVQGEPRAFGLTNSPTTYGPVLVMQLPVLVFIAQLEIMPSLGRRLAAFTAGLTLIALMTSMTRASWLAVVGMVLIFVVMNKNKQYRILTAKICAGVAAILLIVALISPQVHDRFSTMVDAKFQSNTERVLMWQSALNIFSDYPIHGIGQEMFFKVYNEQYISPEAKERPTAERSGHSQAHNNYLNVLCEGGLIGLAAFIGLYAYFLRKFYNQLKREREFAFSAGMTAFLIIAALLIEGLMNTYTNLTSLMRELWLLAGVMIAAEGILKR